jgi:hypothetical protein
MYDTLEALFQQDQAATGLLLLTNIDNRNSFFSLVLDNRDRFAVVVDDHAQLLLIIKSRYTDHVWVTKRNSFDVLMFERCWFG